MDDLVRLFDVIDREFLDSLQGAGNYTRKGLKIE